MTGELEAEGMTENVKEIHRLLTRLTRAVGNEVPVREEQDFINVAWTTEYVGLD
jgi:ribosomal protein S19